MAFKSQHYETPEERLKRMILERLNDAQTSDANGTKKKFCINVKHFLRLMKPHISTDIIEEIESKYKALLVKVKALEGKTDKAKADKETEIVNTEYEVYDELLVYGMDALQSSKVIQKQTGGIILAGKTIKDLEKLGKKIRKSKAVETVLEDIEEGQEQID